MPRNRKPNRHRLHRRPTFRYKLSDINTQYLILLEYSRVEGWTKQMFDKACKSMPKRACKHYGDTGKRYG